MKKQRKKSKGRILLRRLLIADLVLLLAFAAAVLNYEYRSGLIMRGQSRVTLNVGEEFEDPGVRSRFAKVKSNVDTSKPGNYTVKYTLMGKESVRQVHVADPEELVLGLKGSRVQIVKQGDPYIESGAFAVDRRMGAIDPQKIKISGRVNTNKAGDYTVKYSMTSLDVEKETERTVRVVPESEYSECEEIPVMMYHWIYSQDDIPEKINGNWIEDSVLESHLAYLKSESYYYPSWSELAAWVDGRISLPEKSIVLTFDDGKKAFYEHGKPLFEKYSIPVTSFLICWEDNDAKEKVKKYASEYLDFESHTYAMHQAAHMKGHKGIMARMTKEEILADFKMAQQVVANNDAMAYPYGDFTLTGQEAAAEQGFKCALITDYDKVRQGMDKTRLPRMRVLGTQSFESWVSAIE